MSALPTLAVIAVYALLCGGGLLALFWVGLLMVEIAAEPPVTAQEADEIGGGTAAVALIALFAFVTLIVGA